MGIVQLETEALQLSESERALLADCLLQSLSPANPDALAAWTKEAEQRLAAYQRGEIQSVDGASAVARIRKNL